MLDSSYVDKLIKLSRSFDIELSPQQAELSLKHLDFVLETNKKFNLTRITSLDDAVILHILDSLFFSPYVAQAPLGPVLDMGTGAGFPGIPLAITSERSFTLVDSVRKKVDAVKSFVAHLYLSNVSCIHARLEDLAVQQNSHYACVVARAVASLPVLIEYASPFLYKGGLLVLSKGVPSDDESSSGMKAADICGLTFVERSDFDLPDGLGHRSFFIYRKTGSPSVSLPRQAGAAKKHPLA